MTEFGYQREGGKVNNIVNGLAAMVNSGAHAVRQLGSGVLDLCWCGRGSLDVVYSGVAGEGWKPW